jgi:hypothetical protein
MTGRLEGIEVIVEACLALEHARTNEDDGWLTRVAATPRLALHGEVYVQNASRWERLRPWRSGFFQDADLDRALSVRRSSDSVARAVIDERVVATLRELRSRFHELVYSVTRIALSWHGVERTPLVLDQALECVVSLAAAAARTPYR